MSSADHQRITFMAEQLDLVATHHLSILEEESMHEGIEMLSSTTTISGSGVVLHRFRYQGPCQELMAGGGGVTARPDCW
jgi:hypothetical protein